MISVGVLYSGQTLLEIVESGGLAVDHFGTAFAKIEVAEAATVLQIAQDCRWIGIEPDGAIRLTERGMSLREIQEPHLCLREQLHDIILVSAPPWAKRLIQGRYEALKVMTESARQCFVEAGLEAGIDNDVVQWWYAMGRAVRAHRSKTLHDIGLIAERLSLEYEKQRTGLDPVWQGFETTLAGFDVLSVLFSDDPTKLKIEVKGSGMKRSDASFHVSRNEWNTAKLSSAYQFHLWLIRGDPRLFVVPANDIEPHIPKDSGAGKWESAELYFRDFKDFEAQPS